MQPISFWCTVLCRSYCLGSSCFLLPWLLVPASGTQLCVFVSLNRFMEDLCYGHFINCESARPTGA